MSLDDCINLTMYQLYDLVERYMLYVNWDLDIKSRLAGAKGDSKPDNWMKNIPDSLLISEVNLPGTHDSTTQFINFKRFSRCQNKNKENNQSRQNSRSGA